MAPKVPENIDNPENRQNCISREIENVVSNAQQTGNS
jgi:hypothetical protein